MQPGVFFLHRFLVHYHLLVGVVRGIAIEEFVDGRELTLFHQSHSEEVLGFGGVVKSHILVAITIVNITIAPFDVVSGIFVTRPNVRDPIRIGVIVRKRREGAYHLRIGRHEFDPPCTPLSPELDHRPKQQRRSRMTIIVG